MYHIYIHGVLLYVLPNMKVSRLNPPDQYYYIVLGNVSPSKIEAASI